MMIVAGSQSVIRNLNRQAVMHLVRNDEFVTRADLAERLGLARSTIRAIVDELLDEGWLGETLYESRLSRGRRPLRLKVDSSRLVVLGAEVNGGVVTVLGASPRGDIRELSVVETTRDVSQSLDGLANQLKETHARLVSSGLRVCGLGVAVPGGVTPQEGRLIHSERNGWQNVLFRQELQQRLHGHELAQTPLLLSRAINCRARYYLATTHSALEGPLLYVHAGSGVSLALLKGDNVLTGQNGMAGRLSHMRVSAGGRRCDCGQYGCAQMVASMRAMELRLQMPEAKIRALAASGDTEVLGVMRETAEALAGIIHMQSLLFDPAAVFVGGPAFKTGASFHEALQARFDHLGREAGRRAASLQVAPEVQSIAARGAAMLVVPYAIGGTRM